ncbi:hypothetical protein [Parafilimonas sp.]|uniref:hypothetical protein n=1 Tax=Parafilimonas sp. TaxID=1969739 RepID=UPI0039E41CA3
MQPKKENYWVMFRWLLLLNVVLITAIVLARPSKSTTIKKEAPCCSSRKLNADVMNAITVRLM